MVTDVQVKTYLRPLLARNRDVALVGRLLVLKPVHHVLRAVLIDRRSSKESIVPTWFMCHVFGPCPDYFLNWGEQFLERVWKTTDPDISDALCAAIESVALPKLRPIVTLQDFVSSVEEIDGGHMFSVSPNKKSLIDLAMGDHEAARAVCRASICGAHQPGPNEPEVTKAKMSGAKKLCDLLERNDVTGIVRTLHEWEAANVKALKIAHLWEPTPFPVEVKLGLAKA